MEDLFHLSEAQRLVIDKLTSLVGIEQINHIVSHDTASTPWNVHAL